MRFINYGSRPILLHITFDIVLYDTLQLKIGNLIYKMVYIMLEKYDLSPWIYRQMHIHNLQLELTHL